MAPYNVYNAFRVALYSDSTIIQLDAVAHSYCGIKENEMSEIAASATDDEYNVSGISADELANLMRRPDQSIITILDCRAQSEQTGGKIRGAFVLGSEGYSMKDLIKSALFQDRNSSTIVFYCLAGSVSSARYAANFSRLVFAHARGNRAHANDTKPAVSIRYLREGAYGFIKEYHQDPQLVSDFDNDKWGLPLLETCDDEAFSSDSGCETAEDEEATQRHALPSPGYQPISVASAAAKASWMPVPSSTQDCAIDSSELKDVQEEIVLTDSILQRAKGIVYQLQSGAKYLHSILSRKKKMSANIIQRARKDLRRLVAQLEQVARRRDDVLVSRWSIRRLSRSTTVFRVSGGPKEKDRECLRRQTNILERVCNLATKAYTRFTTPDANSSVEGWADLLASSDVVSTLSLAQEKLYCHRMSTKKEDDDALEEAISKYPAKVEAIYILRDILSKLRLMEESFDFHGQLLDDSRAFMSNSMDSVGHGNAGPDSEPSTEFSADSILPSVTSSRYSTENFAYGSTPFSTWFRLMTHKEDNSSSLMSDSGKTWAILGSSSGWLVFYAALLNGASEVHGWEVLPSLHAQAIALANGLTGEYRSRCVFHLDNALNADLSTFSVVVLAAQCWDAWLLDLVYAKICSECAHGTLIIDYNDRSSHFQQNKLGGGTTTDELKMELRLESKKTLRTSWSDSQNFHVWKCIEQMH